MTNGICTSLAMVTPACMDMFGGWLLWHFSGGIGRLLRANYDTSYTAEINANDNT